MRQVNEEWRSVVGWEGLYEVSDLGRVRSLDRIVSYRDGRVRKYSGKVLCPGTLKHGYLLVVLSDAGRKESRTVHSIVAEAFLGTRPPGKQIRHGPDGPSVNTVKNLCYGTVSENQMDRHRDGTANIGTRNGQSKLTPDDIVTIRQSDENQRDAAARLKVSQSLISRIRSGEVWKHIK
jgi:hypothetical protein